MRIAVWSCVNFLFEIGVSLSKLQLSKLMPESIEVN